MIRFIDLSDQITEDTSEFAFYDTVTDKFVEFNGNQTWEDPAQFILDYKGDDVDRFLNLIPDKFYSEF